MRFEDLADQGDGITLVADDGELLVAIAEAAGVPDRVAEASTWDGSVSTQSAIQAEIRRRARTDDRPIEAEPSGTQDKLSELEVLDMPHPISLKPWINQTKNLIGRATNWQIHPLVVNANESSNALRDAITLLEARVADLETKLRDEI